jgi:hypothetical protein
MRVTMPAATENNGIPPFQIKCISATKFPERETATDQSQGVQLVTIQKPGAPVSYLVF